MGVSVPLRGVGCFYEMERAGLFELFPSPCGVWVVSSRRIPHSAKSTFPSPCGVWVVSFSLVVPQHFSQVSVPLRGVGCFVIVFTFTMSC